MVESVWDYPRPPRVEATVKRIVVLHRGEPIADTRSALRVLETTHPPVYYIPLADVLAPVTRIAHQTFCEFKGTASYWDVDAGGLVVPKAAWSYEHPAPGYESLKGRLAFYPAKFDRCEVDGEPVAAQAGDFYGGWITADIAGPFKGGAGTAGW